MQTILRANCVIIGDSCVGKSAIAQVFHSDYTHFPKNYTLTVEGELLTKILPVPDVQNTSVEFFLMDCSGKDVFSSSVSNLIANPDMFMIVYDVTEEKSFTSITSWLDKVRPTRQSNTIPGVLVANKVDLLARRVIDRPDGENLASSKNLAYFECSAKDMKNIDEIFQHLAKSYHNLYENRLEFFKNLG